MIDTPPRPHLSDTEAKATTYAASAALLIAVLTPIRQNWRRRPRDGFPLSYYPMFTVRRKRTGAVVHLVAVDAQGQGQVLHHRHAGTGGLNQVRRQLRRSVKAGHAQEIADRAAVSVGSSSRMAAGAAVEVRVVTSVHEYDAFFAGRREPESQTVHAIASVVRTTR